MRRVFDCVSVQGWQQLRRGMPEWTVRRFRQFLSELRRQLRKLRGAFPHAVHIVPIIRALPARRPVPRCLPRGLLCRQRLVMRSLRCQLRHVQWRDLY